MSAAQQIFYTRFDTAFFQLSPPLQARIESRIDQMGLRLATFPHHRLTGSNRCRLRVGDYRVIYTFDVAGNVIHHWTPARDLPRYLREDEHVAADVSQRISP